MFAVPPGIWLFPNLFEDVGFFESFVPLWAWQKVPKGKKKLAITEKGGGTTIQSKERTEESVTAAVTGEKSLHTTVEDASDDE